MTSEEVFYDLSAGRVVNRTVSRGVEFESDVEDRAVVGEIHNGTHVLPLRPPLINKLHVSQTQDEIEHYLTILVAPPVLGNLGVRRESSQDRSIFLIISVMHVPRARKQILLGQRECVAR